MVPKSSPRIGGVSGLNQFVTQQVYCQPSQTANQRISASTAPAMPRWCSNPCETWVTAKT